MRELKFKLWDEKEKMMVEYLNCSICIDGSGVQSFNSDGEIEGTESNIHLIPLQYTGLKDNNDKEIYEGDIIRNTIGKLEKIVFNKGAFKTQSISHPNANLYLLESYFDYIEVIGNIYENPELLEGSEVEQCSCYKLGKSLNSGMKCSNCGREL